MDCIINHVYLHIKNYIHKLQLVKLVRSRIGVKKIYRSMKKSRTYKNEDLPEIRKPMENL